MDEYKVVYGDDYLQFLADVKYELNYGWKPQGGVAVTFEKGQAGLPNKTTYFQAMVK